MASPTTSLTFLPPAFPKPPTLLTLLTKPRNPLPPSRPYKTTRTHLAPHSRIRSETSRQDHPRGPLSTIDSITPTIQWYPGHIAKAERNLQASLKLVDVVIELRDARIPISTHHPKMEAWLSGKKRVLVFGHSDMVHGKVRGVWKAWGSEKGVGVRFVDGRRGVGVGGLKGEVVRAGGWVNERRVGKGMRERAVRCLVVGFPNVGKSALINRLVGRRAVKVEQRPGVTRVVRWVRVGEKVEMLDMPGVIPVKVEGKMEGVRLAICDEIGSASYDKVIVAGVLVDEIRRVERRWGKEWGDLERVEKCLKVETGELEGGVYLEKVANKLYGGNVDRVAVKLLTDLRKGKLGHVAFEAPEMLDEDDDEDVL